MSKTFQDNFFIPDGTYLLSHSVGPLTKKGHEYLSSKYLNPHKQDGGHAWPKWLDLIDQFNTALSDLLGGSPDEFCPQVNLSSGLTKYLTALPSPGRKNKILMHSHAFPTMGFVASALKSRGYELVLIPKDRDPVDPHVWKDAINDQTAIVLITHVYSNMGALSPVNAIADIARTAGARSVVDIAQSVGIIPIHIPSWNVDAVFGSSVKWLCGGPGAGYMWINPDHLGDLNPEDVGWFSHENPFEFDIQNFRYDRTAKKFLGGTPSIAPFATALGGIETIKDIGIKNIRAHNVSLMQHVHPDIDPTRNGGTLCLRLSDEIFEGLKTSNIQYDQRGQTARLSFHIYNTLEEADQVRAIISS